MSSASMSGSKGKWRVFSRLGGKGARRRAHGTYESRQEAEECLRAVQRECDDFDAASSVPSSADPLRALVLRYNADRLARRDARDAYIKLSANYLSRIFEEEEWKRLDDITSLGVVTWRAKHKAVTTANYLLRILKAFLRWADESGLRIDARVLKIKVGRHERAEVPPLITDSQMSEIIGRCASFEGSYQLLVTHLAMYPCRPVDLCKVQVKDFNAGKMTIKYRDTKNKSDHTHPVHHEHAIALKELCQGRGPEEYIFQHHGRNWAIDETGRAEELGSWYYHNIGRYLHSKGIIDARQRGIYCIKDYAMTKLALAAKGNRKVITSISGHKSLTVIDRYMASNDDAQSALLAAISIPTAPKNKAS